MSIRIGINGLGRIGRNLWRIIHAEAPDIEIVAANDTADLATVVHLLRYDTIRGRFPAVVESAGEAIVVADRVAPLTHAPTPDLIDWGAHGVDVVIESTGQFVRGQGARGHLSRGAPLVVVSTASPDADTVLMMGINEQNFDPERHRVLSNSCCTTYCLAAMIGPMHQVCQVVSGAAMVAYAHGSRPGPLLDEVFPNPRMARANALSLVPANIPGVRHALDKVLPDLCGRITATAMRVPVPAISAATLTLRLAQPATSDEVNGILQAASASLLKGYLEVSPDPLVSTDLLGSAASCTVDPELTASLGELVRVVGWYDNEWGYAHRLVDLVRYVARRRTA